MARNLQPLPGLGQLNCVLVIWPFILNSCFLLFFAIFEEFFVIGHLVRLRFQICYTGLGFLLLHAFCHFHDRDSESGRDQHATDDDVQILVGTSGSRLVYHRLSGSGSGHHWLDGRGLTGGWGRCTRRGCARFGLFPLLLLLLPLGFFVCFFLSFLFCCFVSFSLFSLFLSLDLCAGRFFGYLFEGGSFLCSDPGVCGLSCFSGGLCVCLGSGSCLGLLFGLQGCGCLFLLLFQ
jgi:hypothetical protein